MSLKYVDPPTASRVATVTGTSQVVPREQLGRVDLIQEIAVNSVNASGRFVWNNSGNTTTMQQQMLDPPTYACTWANLQGALKTVDSGAEMSPTLDVPDSSVDQTSVAMALFNQCNRRVAGGSLIGDSIEDRRNAVQSTIMATAARNCEVFKLMTASVDSHTSFAFGSLATVTGVLGAVVNAPNAAKYFSGAAGGFSGLEAEFGRAFFKDKAVNVIFAGIDMKRQDVAKDIAGKRDHGYTTYNLQDAINDAVRYNGACSVVEGLKQVTDRLAQGAGIAEARDVMLRVMQTRDQVEAAAITDPTKRKERYQQLAAAADDEAKYVKAIGAPAQAAAVSPEAAKGAPEAGGKLSVEKILAGGGTLSQIVAAQAAREKDAAAAGLAAQQAQGKLKGLGDEKNARFAAPLDLTLEDCAISDLPKKVVDICKPGDKSASDALAKIKVSEVEKACTFKWISSSAKKACEAYVTASQAYDDMDNLKKLKDSERDAASADAALLKSLKATHESLISDLTPKLKTVTDKRQILALYAAAGENVPDKSAPEAALVAHLTAALPGYTTATNASLVPLIRQ